MGKDNSKKYLQTYLEKHSPIKRGVIKEKDEDKELDQYNKICSNIYLGNYKSAKNKELFVKKGIKAVLNCTKDIDIPNYFINHNVEYMRIPVDDSLKQVDINLMTRFLPAAVEFIHKHAVIQRQPVLVHCVAGRERSCIAIAAYLVKYKNLSPEEAYVFILKKRPEAFFFGKSINFDKSLEEYYNSIKQ